MEKLFLYYRRLRDLLIYSDTQVMELALVLVVCLINPSSMERLNTTPDFWVYSGAVLGLFLLMGIIVTKSLFSIFDIPLAVFSC